MRVELLGPLRVQIDGEECEIVGPMRRQLIALLALHPGQSFSTDRLTELLWDGEPPASAASSLRVHVAQLRRALGDPGLLERTDTGYRLAIEPENIDLVKFESHIRMGRAALSDGDLASAREALGCARDLWRGVPFSDVRVGSAVDVERLFSLRSELSVDLAEVAMRSEGARANTSELSALTVERPFDERVWSLLITALYWSGRQSEALETYLRAITALRDELGVDPTPRLRRLQEQILHHDPALDPPRNAQVDLPTFPTSFVGRESEVSEIAELLRTHRIVTLTGLGGVGKTRLSVAAAEHAGSNFDHGVIFVSLASLEDESLVCTTVAGALGARATTARELAATIEHRKLLLVLDNCEHLLTTITSLISELCERCPRLRILATSRIPLNLVGECVWVTPTLDRSTGDGAHPDSVNLFLERAAQADPHSNLPAPDSPLMIEIAELLGGVPLAIELTAARCNILTVADIAVRLRTAMSATARETDRPDRHSSMEVVIEGTLRHLSPQAQLLLARLPLFLGPVGIEAIETICADADLPAESIQDAVAELAHTSIIVADTSGEHARYWLLPPIRRAAPQVLPDSSIDEMGTRHLDYFCALAAENGPTINGPESALALARIDAVIADMRAALTYAVQAAPRRGLEMATALSPFWMRTRMTTEGRNWMRELLAADDGVDQGVLAAALHSSGGLAWDDGDHREAERLLREAWQIRSELGDTIGLGLTLNNLAGISSDQGDHSAAEEMWREAHAMFVDGGHQLGAAASQINRGIALHKLGRLTDASEILEGGRVAAATLGSSSLEAMTIERLAAVRAEQGLFRDALTLTRAAHVIYDDAGTAEDHARLRWQRALRHRELGEIEASIDQLRASARAVIADRLFDAWWVSSLIETAAALHANSRPDHAAGLIAVAERHRARSGHGSDAATVHDLDDVRRQLTAVLGADVLAEEMIARGTRSISSVMAEIAASAPQSVRLADDMR